jgi:RHH-type proline utilization regulon transcriptional repressor/proline dehydrogenase/delta 1-pyrroline-5-carboxylate dehydrogenase
MIHGESNDFRYRPRPWFVLRIQDPINAQRKLEVALALLAGMISQVRCEISIPVETNFDLRPLSQIFGAALISESEHQLAVRLSQMKGGTLRILGGYDAQVFAPAVIGNIPIISSKVFANGRLELLNYLKEQSVTQTMHRYGNIV